MNKVVQARSLFFIKEEQEYILACIVCYLISTDSKNFNRTVSSSEVSRICHRQDGKHESLKARDFVFQRHRDKQKLG